MSESTHPAGVGRLTDGVVVGVGRALAGRHARVGLDQVTLQVKPDRLLVDTSAELLANVSGRHRVQGACDLHVMIGMHFGLAPARDIKWLCRSGQQKSPLFLGKYLARDTPRGAMNAAASKVSGPRFGSVAKEHDVVRERLTREPALAYEWHLIFDARLVARVTYAGRVDEEVARLRVLRERGIDGWVLCAGPHDGGTGVAQYDAMGDSAEELPRGIKPSTSASVVCKNVGHTNW